MKKFLLSGFCALILVSSLFSQIPGRTPLPAADRAKNTVDRISQSVAFTKQQKADITTIYTKFFEDVRNQQAFRDASKMDPLEKARDLKVSKLLNNPALYKKYQAAVDEMKKQFQARQNLRK
jgi:hypothetical protein